MTVELNYEFSGQLAPSVDAQVILCALTTSNPGLLINLVRIEGKQTINTGYVVNDGRILSRAHYDEGGV